MTLKEKFKQWLDTNPRKEIREAQLEVIADKYAIGFAEWIEKKNYWYAKGINCYYKYGDKQSEYTTKELLEIYKKEL
jgi:hypothetical protein